MISEKGQRDAKGYRLYCCAVGSSLPRLPGEFGTESLCPELPKSLVAWHRVNPTPTTINELRFDSGAIISPQS